VKAFEFAKPNTAAEAVALLKKHAPHAKPLAGGTDLLVEIKHDAHLPHMLVDVSRIEELRRIELNDDGLHIGASVTHTEIMTHDLVKQYAPVLIDAAHTIGAVQTRNLGTLAGNLVTCVPSMDSGPALLALEAEIVIAGPGGSRQIPLDEFFVGPRKTCLEPEELVLDIIVPKRNLSKPIEFIKFGLRKGQALALVNVAAATWLGDKADTFKAPCIALGAVAPVVMRAGEAEKYLEGRKISEDAMAEAGRIAAKQAKPISDFRASAEYRLDLIEVLTRRALSAAVDIARQS
jgi:carbon-monoxide dehydrogenase medium subunit